MNPADPADPDGTGDTSDSGLPLTAAILLVAAVIAYLLKRYFL